MLGSSMAGLYFYRKTSLMFNHFNLQFSWRCTLLAISLSMTVCLAAAQTPAPAAPAANANASGAEAAIRAALQPKLAPGAKIESVTRTPVAGLYEVRVNNDVVYMDEQGKFMIAGQITDIAAGKNITQDRLDKLNAELVWSKDTLKHSFKMVNGSGKRQLVVFEDPNCSYCKKLREGLEKMKDLTVHTLLLPILAEDSSKKSRDVWCSPDRLKAYDDWMLRGKAPAAAKEKCEDPNDEVMEIGQKLRLRGVPAIFFTDGSRAPGFLPPEEIEKRLAAIKAN
jgi:thiol:disulfide interchange protein DsbC